MELPKNFPAEQYKKIPQDILVLVDYLLSLGYQFKWSSGALALWTELDKSILEDKLFKRIYSSYDFVSTTKVTLYISELDSTENKMTLLVFFPGTNW